jgi:hypothetical protein
VPTRWSATACACAQPLRRWTPPRTLIAASIAAGTPMLLAAIGILVHERTGVVNLGVEGMMLTAAIVAFAVAHGSGSHLLGFAAGALAGAALAAVFAFFALVLHANQYATGLAIALLGAGASAFIGLPYSGEGLPARGADGIAVLRDVPFSGRSCSATTCWCTSRCCWSARWRGCCSAPAPAWSCAQSASRRSRRTRSASPCAACGSRRCCSAVPAPGLPGRIWPPSTRRCGPRT